MHKKIIYSLVAVSVVLLFLNLFADIFINSKVVPQKTNMDSKTLEKKILNVLNTFAIKPEWISRKIKSNNAENTIFYQVKIPVSIKQPILINEIVSSVENEITKINSVEESIGGNSTLRFINDKKLIVNLKLIYDDTIERESADLAFILYCNDTISKEELMEIKSYLSSFHLLIPLTDDAKIISSLAYSMNINYSILLNSEISPTFEIDEDDSKKSILSQVERIIGSFPNAKSFIYDPNYSICSSKIFPFIKSEFMARKKELLSKIKFHSLENKEGDEQKSLLRYYYVKYAGQNLQNIIIPFTDLSSLCEEIKKAQLKGHHFIEPVF